MDITEQPEQPIKIYETLNFFEEGDFTYVAARSIEGGQIALAMECGYLCELEGVKIQINPDKLTNTQANELNKFFYECGKPILRPLKQVEYDNLSYLDEETGVPIKFREGLNKLIEEGVNIPCFFVSTFEGYSDS